MQLEAATSRLSSALQALGVWPRDPSAQRALADSLLRYVALLVKWNRTYNLTAVREPEQMLVQHVFDCAAIVAPLKELVQERRALPDADGARWRIVDVGSGAGLPGVVLALLWPEADLVLVEPVAKKAAFLHQVKTELALANLTIARCRVEDLPASDVPPDAIVCRAFASLADYVAALGPLPGPRTVVAAMKAHVDEAEKCALTNQWRICRDIPLHVPELGAARRLVVLEHSTLIAQKQETHERN